MEQVIPPFKVLFIFVKIVNWGQFYQHSTCSFYARRSQKRKKDCQVKQFFVLLGSSSVKAACRMLVKLTPDLFEKWWKILITRTSTRSRVNPARQTRRRAWVRRTQSRHCRSNRPFESHSWEVLSWNKRTRFRPVSWQQKNRLDESTNYFQPQNHNDK